QAIDGAINSASTNTAVSTSSVVLIAAPPCIQRIALAAASSRPAATDSAAAADRPIRFGRERPASCTSTAGCASKVRAVEFIGGGALLPTAGRIALSADSKSCIEA